ncbi:MAG: MATE family efflux transporter [Bacteroidetes bacterium]|uniref:Multidrug-efflux transporter n=1 Tax=Candidatus Pullibacteroides excrementavium TaxID=2840905 RepID=A0A9D9DWS6_9BACT|nr:MATE family efflux transporter [Candidatus Pullibacteroides excrementavium]
MSSPTSLGLPQNSDISYKRIFGIAFPIILSSLAQNLISLADTIFLGNLGEVQLGAAALAVIFYQVVYMTVFGFGVGAQIMMARRLGQGQKHAIGRIFQHALWFCLAAALLCWILYQFFGESMIFSMVHTEDTGRAVLDYLNVRVYGFPFAFACVAFNAFYVGIARTRNISIATLVMGVVNVVLDYVLVFGVWGFPRMEMAGAALASVIAEICGLLTYILLTWFSGHRKTYSPFRRFPLQIKLVGSLLQLSYPVMIQYFLSFANYFLFFLFIESLGQHALAIANITRSMYVLFLIPTWGFASTTATLTSYLCGQGRTGDIMTVVKRCLLLVTICVSFIVVLYLPFNRQVLGIFTKDVLLAAESFAPSLVAILATYLMGVAQVVFNTILGRGRTKAGFFIEFANMVLYFLYGWIFIYIGHCSVAVAFGTEVCYTLGLLFISLGYIAIMRKRGKLDAATV